MGFLEKTVENISLKIAGESPFFKAVLYGETAGFFQGVKGVASYKPDDITLSLKKGFITVKGEGLSIEKYCEGDVLICGKITAVTRE